MRALSGSGYAGVTVALGLALSLIAVPSFAAGRQDPTTDQPARPTVTVTVTVPPATASPTAAADGPRTTTGVHATAQTLPALPYAGTSAAGASATGTSATGTSAKQLLDLYLPERTGTAVPLVVVVHGGAFNSGGRGEEAPTAGALVAHGYAVASIDYRLSQDAPFPAGVQDVKAAVRWLRAHAGEYGLDPGRFAAWGESAGGHLAAMIGASGYQVTGLDDPALGNPTVSSAVQAVVDFYGPSDFLSMDQQLKAGGCDAAAQSHDGQDSPESQWLGAAIQTVPQLAAAADPISYVRSAQILPRFLIAHGGADCTVPPGQSRALVTALADAGVPAVYHELAGAGHSDPRFDAEEREPAIRFLDEALARAT